MSAYPPPIHSDQSIFNYGNFVTTAPLTKQVANSLYVKKGLNTTNMNNLVLAGTESDHGSTTLGTKRCWDLVVDAGTNAGTSTVTCGDASVDSLQQKIVRTNNLKGPLLMDTTSVSGNLSAYDITCHSINSGTVTFDHITSTGSALSSFSGPVSLTGTSAALSTLTSGPIQVNDGNDFLMMNLNRVGGVAPAGAGQGYQVAGTLQSFSAGGNLDTSTGGNGYWEADILRSGSINLATPGTNSALYMDKNSISLGGSGALPLVSRGTFTAPGITSSAGFTASGATASTMAGPLTLTGTSAALSTLTSGPIQVNDGNDFLMMNLNRVGGVAPAGAGQGYQVAGTLQSFSAGGNLDTSTGGNGYWEADILRSGSINLATPGTNSALYMDKNSISLGGSGALPLVSRGTFTAPGITSSAGFTASGTTTSTMAGPLTLSGSTTNGLLTCAQLVDSGSMSAVGITSSAGFTASGTTTSTMAGPLTLSGNSTEGLMTANRFVGTGTTGSTLAGPLTLSGSSSTGLLTAAQLSITGGVTSNLGSVITSDISNPGTMTVGGPLTFTGTTDQIILKYGGQVLDNGGYIVMDMGTNSSQKFAVAVVGQPKMTLDRSGNMSVTGKLTSSSLVGSDSTSGCTIAFITNTPVTLFDPIFPSTYILTATNITYDDSGVWFIQCNRVGGNHIVVTTMVNSINATVITLSGSHLQITFAYNDSLNFSYIRLL